MKVSVKWGKSSYDVEVDGAEGLDVFQAALFSLTSVPVERQKLLYKGKFLKSDADVQALPSEAKLTLMGTAEQLPSAPTKAVLFEEDLTDKDRVALAPSTLTSAGLVNLGNTCLPEHDSRVLTNCGFLFLADIEARIDAGEEVLYACYDTATQSIVYKPGQLVEAAPPQRWVDFTQAGTRQLWDATSDDYGSTVPTNGAYANHLTLRTTPDHTMYLQLCTRYGEDGHEVYEPRVAGRAPIPPHRQPARELAPGYQCDCVAAGRTCTHSYSHYRMYTGAASGLQTPADVISLTDSHPHSPVVALGLRSQDELDAFLELFGYWLGDGSMSHDTRAALTSNDAVHFAPSQHRDRVYLQGLLDRLHLVRGVHFTSNESELGLEVRITKRSWFRFFDDEFGVKYSNSTHYDQRLALLKQGMHSTQRRPSTASSVSASSIASVAIASSTRALSVSASARLTLPLSSSAGAGLMEHFEHDEPRWCAECGNDFLWWEEDASCWHCGRCDGPATVWPAATDESMRGDDQEEDDDDPVKSAKWLPDWVLFRLDAAQLRLVIEGLRQADGRSAASTAQLKSAAAGGNAMQGLRQICTSSVGFRDQLIHACMHAGYSAYFQLSTPAGQVRSFKSVPTGSCIYTKEEMEAALRVDSTRQFNGVRGPVRQLVGVLQ